MTRNIRFRAIFTILLLFLSPQIGHADGKNLRVLTFNTWMVRKLGISISSKLENYRLPIMIKKIKELNPDIIAVQEVWSFGLRDQLIAGMKDKYPYFYHRGFHVGMGDGMVLFSKFPFIKDEKIDAHIYEDGTTLEEWHLIYGIGVQKGVFRVGVNVDGHLFDVFTTHMGAVYFDEKTNDYKPDEVAARRTQMYELKQFILSKSHPNREIILLGDMNTHFFEWDSTTSQRVRKRTPEYEDITNALKFNDAFMKANNIDLDHDPLESLQIATFDTKNNYYARKGFFSKLPTEFIDYVFYKPSLRLFPKSGRLVFNQPLTREDLTSVEPFLSQPNLFSSDPEKTPLFLSDHWGVLLDFILQD